MSQMTWTDVDAYIAHNLIPHDRLMDKVLTACREAGLPAIEVTPAQGRLLNLLVRISHARLVLEIGTLGGYSSIWMGRALPPGGRLISLEKIPPRGNRRRERICKEAARSHASTHKRGRESGKVG